MTNDYKDKLLKYLTGNITEELESNLPYYAEQTSRVNNDSSPTGYSFSQTMGVLYCKNGNGENTGKVIVYGNGTNDQTNWYGYLQLFDENFNLLKTINNYDSGTKLSPFEVLNVDEVGQIYGIDYSSNKHRFIMLNNVSEKGNLLDYQCVLRQSYFLQGDITNTYIDFYSFSMTTNMLCVEKSKQSELYFIGGMDGGRDILYATSFRINVGSENEWGEFDFGVLYRGFFVDSYVYFDQDDNISCSFYFEEENIGDSTHQISRVSNTGTSLDQYSVLVNNLEQYVPTLTNVTGIIINKDKFYFGVAGVDSSNTIAKVFLYDNANITSIYDKQVIGAYQSNVIKVNFAMINNLYFCVIPIVTEIVSENLIGKVYINLLNDENIDYEKEVPDVLYLNQTPNIILSNNFNMYNVSVSAYPNVVDPDYMIYITTYVHRNGYNGEEYEGKTSLYPQQGLLFDENNSLIFARDLYNNKVYNNRSISVLNVPNTFLNETTIEKKELLSATNTTIVSQTDSITKNIYEDLYINFNNQITMSNQNETNHIENMTGAIRLNQSSGKQLDYENAKATKIKVTYDDDTSYITSVANSINDGVCTYSIGVHVPNDKNIDKIEIISQDENTIYQTITNLNLENNKYYIITQDVYVV